MMILLNFTILTVVFVSNKIYAVSSFPLSQQVRLVPGACLHQDSGLSTQE